MLWLAFRDALNGPPPSRFSIPNSSVNRLGAAHIPLKRGGADGAGMQASMFAGGIGDRPTSLNGGEGLLPGRRVWLEASWSGEGEGGSLQSRGLGGIENKINHEIKGQR
jgi:hypothetical protein